VCWHKALSASQGKQQGKKQQREKSNGSLQNKYNWIVEPYAVRISVPEDEAGPAGSEHYQPHAAEVQPRRHQQASERNPRRTVAQQIKNVGGLVYRENEIENVNGDGCPKDAEASQFPAQFSPAARLPFVTCLSREVKPTRT
jgi:hypothetical protein